MYLTTVSIYLLFLSVIELSVAGYIYYNLSEALVTIADNKVEYPFGWTFLNLGREYLGSLILYLVSLSILSMIGAILLLRKNKHRSIISLSAIAMWTVTLSYMTFGWLLAPISFIYNATSFVTGISLVVLTAIMYLILAKGWHEQCNHRLSLTRIPKIQSFVKGLVAQAYEQEKNASSNI